jgi:hypothetical protein
VHQRWQAWHRELLDPYVPPATERHLIARGVARLHCLRQAAGEKRAARETKQLLDGYFRRTGRCKAILDIEDISAELYALGRGKVGKTGILRLREDGIVYFDPRAMRDALRKASLAAGGIGAEPENHLDQKALDAATSADEADLRAALLDQCDEIDQLIIENWDSTDVAVAKQVDLTPQAVGKRRKKILDMANRLRSRTRE